MKVRTIQNSRDRSQVIPVEIYPSKLLSFTKNPLSGLVIAIMVTLPFILFGSFKGFSLQSIAGIILIAWLAAENGGNDVSKGIAPLVASGTKDITALIYGSIVTAVGSMVSIFFSVKLLKLFTEGLIQSNFTVTSMLALAMVTGATLWVALATRFSLPVSTTHAIIGSVIFVGCIAFGFSSVMWSNLGNKVVLPLLLSPVLGLSISWILTFFINRISLPDKAGKFITWISSGAICFVRSVNDTPKIVALSALVAMITIHTDNLLSLIPLFLLVTIAMGVGSLIKGLAVTQLLARKVTKLDDRSSLASVLATTALVMSSSQLGLPVSTTHVSTTAIIGAGLQNKNNSINWSVVKDMALSWIITLPGAGVIALIAYAILKFIG